MVLVGVPTDKTLLKKRTLNSRKAIGSKKAKALKASRRLRMSTGSNKTYSTFVNQLIVASDMAEASDNKKR